MHASAKMMHFFVFCFFFSFTVVVIESLKARLFYEEQNQNKNEATNQIEEEIERVQKS
jgi:hypothetical protein